MPLVARLYYKVLLSLQISIHRMEIWNYNPVSAEFTHLNMHCLLLYFALSIPPSEWPCISFTDNYMDLFHREALIRMLEILIASIISHSPLIHTLHLHSIPPSIHPFLHRHSNCLRMRKKQSAMLKRREKGESKMGKAKERKEGCDDKWRKYGTCEQNTVVLYSFCGYAKHK